MQYTEEERQCYDSLKNKGKWTVFGNDTKAIVRFVSRVMGPDYKFEITTQKSIFGTANVVEPLNI
jgi:hypothetical protein